MNRAFLSATLGLVLAGTLSAQAQQAPTAPESTQQPAAAEHHHRSNPRREAAMLSRRLNLSDDQRAKLEPILADRDQKLSALKANTALAPQDFKQQRHAIQADTRQQLQTVLTPEQLDQMKSMRHHGPHTQNQPAPGL